VISLVFPIHPETIKENAREKTYPASSWLITRFESDALFKLIADQLTAQLLTEDIQSIYVQKSVPYRVLREKDMPLYANWSERHIAYACGLGTFGLHRGLITQKGAAHRLMSLVVNTACDGYGAMVENPFASCLYLSQKKCGACIKRCPAGAISTNGHDLQKCRDYSYGKMQAISQEKIGHATGGCALCMTGVPCAERKTELKNIKLEVVNIKLQIRNNLC
jgi:epoxyqueuosine reductase